MLWKRNGPRYGPGVHVMSRPGDPLVVTATVRTAAELTTKRVIDVEENIERRIGHDIRLEVVVERVVGRDRTTNDEQNDSNRQNVPVRRIAFLTTAA